MKLLILAYFENMLSVNPEIRTQETLSFFRNTGKNLLIDFYIPPDSVKGQFDVLLINDGQDLQTMGFDSMLSKLYRSNAIRPLLCIGIHADHA